jgi:hypothetical protein
MKTQSPPLAKRILLNLTMAIVLLPFFGIFFSIVSLSHLADGLWSGEMAVGERCLFAGLLVIVPLAALAMILWKGSSRLPLVMLLLAFWGFGMTQRSSSPPVYRHIGLMVGYYTPTVGVDVSCNGVHLGKTPFSISRDEFNKKVPPWTKPPRQELLTADWSPGRPMTGPFPGQDWMTAKYAWAPADVFERYDHWPPTDNFNRDDKEARRMLKAARYWWHFETDGHQGVCGTDNLSNGSHGTNGRLEVSVSPQIQYPALQPHLELVIDGLNAEKWPPSAAWIAYFRKYENLLFMPFCEKTRSDPRLREALDAVVRAEFDLPAKPTPDDCERILAVILDRAQSSGCFQIPSPESIAIDLMGEAAKESVVRHFREESAGRMSGDGGWSGGAGSSYVIFHRTGNTARLLPLEYAVKRLQPPELFDLLVYRWARSGQGLELVGCYQNDTAAQLVINYYVFDVGHRGDQFGVDRALQMAATIKNNPSVESWLRNFVRDNGAGSFRQYYVQQFIESRIGAAGIDQGSLADWVNHWAPLDDQTKRRFLVRINSPSVSTYMNFMGGMNNSGGREEVLNELAAHPNPSLDQWLTLEYGWTRQPQFVDYGYGSVTRALIRIDTPAVRKFITEQWRRKSDRDTLLAALATQDKADLARLVWMMPLVAQLTDAPSQLKAARLLASFHTPEAMKLLDQWSREGNAEVREAVAQQYQEQRKQDAEQAHRLQQWSDLLAGKIQAQDLVPPQKPWNWNGKEYVQEK